MRYRPVIPETLFTESESFESFSFLRQYLIYSPLTRRITSNSNVLRRGNITLRSKCTKDSDVTWRGHVSNLLEIDLSSMVWFGERPKASIRAVIVGLINFQLTSTENWFGMSNYLTEKPPQTIIKLCLSSKRFMG